MDSYFAPAERKDSNGIIKDIISIGSNPIISAFLNRIGCVIAVLNQERQILSVNQAFLDLLKLKESKSILGLRPGEALNCVFAGEGPGGCGTSPYCSSCGAAIAIVTSLTEGTTTEKICALKAHDRNDKDMELALLVKAQIIENHQEPYILLFLQDITLQQQRAALERTFFHDVNNMLAGLIGASDLLSQGVQLGEMTQIIQQTSWRLKKEVDIQRALLNNDFGSFKLQLQNVNAREVQRELGSFFINHPVAKGRNLKIQFCDELPLHTDLSLLLRVLCNMITNALEASKEEEDVKFWAEETDGMVRFCIWNPSSIPSHIALRMFQKNFSTKGGAGRGIGTYSMKLLGEQILQGKIDFSSSVDEGTLFSFKLPMVRG